MSLNFFFPEKSPAADVDNAQHVHGCFAPTWASACRRNSRTLPFPSLVDLEAGMAKPLGKTGEFFKRRDE